MAAIRWRAEVNALTVPQSYKIRFLPNGNLNTDEIAIGMTAINPALTPDLAKASISALIQTLQQTLINGNQATLDDSIVFGLSFTGRLEGPDDPLPPLAETLHVRAYVTANFLKEIHYQAKVVQESMIEKVPVINQAENATLHLNDVLASTDILQLTGENLDFDPRLGNGECVIVGTRSGRAVQTQFGPISNTNIILIPTIPAQDDDWNNEYTLSLAVRYTEHGTLRTGMYRHRLRTPLTVVLDEETETGILTGNATAAYVTVTDGTASEDTKLRIQVLQDVAANELLFSLLDMQEGGMVGTAVSVTENGDYTLSGFFGSALTDLDITVNNYAGLWELIRSDYGNRLVDVLDVKVE